MFPVLNSVNKWRYQITDWLFHFKTTDNFQYNFFVNWAEPSAKEKINKNLKPSAIEEHNALQKNRNTNCFRFLFIILFVLLVRPLPVTFVAFHYPISLNFFNLIMHVLIGLFYKPFPVFGYVLLFACEELCCVFVLACWLCQCAGGVSGIVAFWGVTQLIHDLQLAYFLTFAISWFHWFFCYYVICCRMFWLLLWLSVVWVLLPS